MNTMQSVAGNLYTSTRLVGLKLMTRKSWKTSRNANINTWLRILKGEMSSLLTLDTYSVWLNKTLSIFAFTSQVNFNPKSVIIGNNSHNSYFENLIQIKYLKAPKNRCFLWSFLHVLNGLLNQNQPLRPK